MKKFLLRIVTVILVVLSVVSISGCSTYVKDGSVIKDVTFKVSYENDGETVDINGTMSLYQTFAPKTYERVLGLIKDGYYNNSSLVFDENGSYLILGAFTYDNNAYVDKKYTGSGLEGEFTNNGFQSRLSIEAGSLVMLREPDTGVGETGKFDTAKASIAICLNASPNGLNNSDYCVFGKIDSESVTALNTMKERVFEDEDGYSSMRLIGERNETSGLYESEGNSYKGAFNYYVNGSEYYHLVNGSYKAFEYAEETDKDYEAFKVLNTDSEYLDRVVLLQTPVTISNFKA